MVIMDDKKKRLVPALRFDGFEGEWESIRYGNIYTFYSTNSFSRDNLNYEKGAVKNIHYGDIHTKFQTMFDIEKELVPFVNDDINISRIASDNYCKEKDLVIADASEDYADIGKSIEIINLNKECVIAGLHTFLARPNKRDLASGFGGYLMQSWSIRKQIMTIAQGTKVLGLSTKRVVNVLLTIPTLPEQQKIANFLSSVDKKIEQLRQKENLLEDYKKGVMQQIFSQQIRFKEDNGEAFADWELKRLGEVAKKVNLKNKSNVINFVLTNSATQGIVSQQDYFDKNIANQNNLEGYYIVDKDDFVYNPRISTSAPVGPIKRNCLRKGVMSPLYTVFRFNKGDLKFLEYFFETTGWHKYMKSIANYGARHDRMNITSIGFQKMPIPFPELKEQQKIANYLSSIDKKIEQTKTQLKQAQTFKKGLLQQLFV